MVHLQVVGIPLSAYRRLRPDLARWAAMLEPEARIRFAPSNHERAPIIGDRELHQIDANIQDGFSHIAVMASKSASTVASRYQYDCRVAFVAGLEGEAADLSVGDLTAALEAILRYEIRWKDVVGPGDGNNHPLLLPPSSFVPYAEVWDFWHNCDCYRETIRIDGANTVLQKVRARHRRSRAGVGTVWIDDGDRQFVIDPSRHGLAADGREGRRLFRFAHDVPADFHYDVSHVRGRPFRIRDRHGTQTTVARANVNPWGDVRPAKSS
jgi:hypothetical protein